MNGILYIVFARATVGLIVRAGTIVDAPPYCRGLVGRDVRVVAATLKSRARSIRWIPDRTTEPAP